MIKPIAFSLAKRLIADPRVQAWALSQAIRVAPHVASAGRRAAAAAKDAHLPRALLSRLERSLQKKPAATPAVRRPAR